MMDKAVVLQSTHRLASKSKFAKRLLFSFIIGLCFILLVLMIGMFGYHYIENLSWIDAFVSASMIMSGMGQVGELTTTSGKLFAGLYALFSGLLFILIVGIIFAPVFHRIVHKLNIEDSISPD